MATLYVSHLAVSQDELGRYITTLTQEIVSKINSHEEQILIRTLLELDEQEGCIEYHNNNYSELDVRGTAVQKAINVINKVAGQELLKPVTKIDSEALYRIEVEE